jgi:hypothetical protein
VKLAHWVIVGLDAVINSFAPGKPHMCSHPLLHELKEVLNYDLALNGERFAVFPKLQALAEDKGPAHSTSS